MTTPYVYNEFSRRIRFSFKY